MELTEGERKAKERLCFALNTVDSNTALKWAAESEGLIGYRKIETDLLLGGIINGLNIIERLSRGGKIFFDPKIHTTPPAAYRAARAITSFGLVEMFNVHLEGGEIMCRNAMDGVNQEYEKMQKTRKNPFPKPKTLGITVLSTESKNRELVLKRSEQAKKWGLDGIVAPAFMGGRLEKEFGDDFLYVLPGIEFNGKYGLTQQNHYPLEKAAFENKNSILVVGEPFLNAPNMKETIYNAIKIVSKASSS